MAAAATFNFLKSVAQSGGKLIQEVVTDSIKEYSKNPENLKNIVNLGASLISGDTKQVETAKA